MTALGRSALARALGVPRILCESCRRRDAERVVIVRGGWAGSAFAVCGGCAPDA